MWNFNNGHCLKKLEGLIEAEVTGILAFSEKSVIYTAGWNKCINVYRDDKDVSTTTSRVVVLVFLKLRSN